MATLSISKAWEEGARFAAREFRLLFPIALLLIALPAVLVGLFTPPPNSPEMYDFALWVQANYGLYLAITLTVTLVQVALNTLGGLAITRLALQPGTSVKEGFGVAIRRLPATLGAVLLISIAGAAAMFAFGYATGLNFTMGGPARTPTPEEAGGMAMMVLILAIAAIALWSRLVTLTAVGAEEKVGPVGIIARSWRLTSGHFWRLFGTLLLLVLIYLLIALALAFVFGLLVFVAVGNPTISSTAAFILNLLVALVTSIIAVFLLAFMARIYAQLAGTPAPAAVATP